MPKPKKQHHPSKAIRAFELKGTKRTYYTKRIKAYSSGEELPQFNRDHKFYTPSFVLPTLYANNNFNY
jgi:hypothetical protein